MATSLPMEVSESTPSKGGMLYIVDDDPAVLTAMELLARCCGWNVRSFESGPAFLEASIDSCQACLLLDLNMPKMDGEEVLRRLRARGSELPVLVITGDRQGSRLERVRRLGASGVLEKPFGEEAFQQAIRRCLELDTSSRQKLVRSST